MKKGFSEYVELISRRYLVASQVDDLKTTCPPSEDSVQLASESRKLWSEVFVPTSVFISDFSKRSKVVLRYPCENRLNQARVKVK